VTAVTASARRRGWVYVAGTGELIECRGHQSALETKTARTALTNADALYSSGVMLDRCAMDN